MKNSIIKATAFLLAFIMAFSALTVGVSAVSASVAPGIDKAGAALVTGDFTAEPKPGIVNYYRFVALETGWYEIYSLGNYDTAANLFSSAPWYLWASEDDGEGKNFKLLYPLTAGETYYLTIETYETKKVMFDVKFEFLGEVELEVISYPTKNIYIKGYDTGTLSNGTEHVSIPYDGFEIKLTFGSGKIITFNDANIGNFFAGYEYDNLRTGANEICFRHGDAEVRWEIEIIENPVSSIEVVRLPDKTEYIHLIEGRTYSWAPFMKWFDPYLDLSGMKIKINYTDSTNETIEVDDSYDSSSVRIKHNGYDIAIGCHEASVGKNNVYVWYIGKMTTFEIDVVKPNIMQYFILGMMDIVHFFAAINNTENSFLKRISDWLHDFALKV